MISRSRRRRAYSYIRFSTPEQLRGDSLRRQRELSQQWCEQNGYELDDSLKLRDLGISAFKGRNATEGRLGAFIKAVDEKRVPPGSVLIVESLDRLSRNEISEALELFLGLLRRGIEIVTLTPGDHFTKKSINDVVKIIVVIVVMSRAYEESATKSKRIREARNTARQKARDEGRLVTSQAPVWLDVVDGKFKIVPEAASTIRRLFKLKLKGTGTDSIARLLNEDAKAWRPRRRRIPRGKPTKDDPQGAALGPAEWVTTDGWRGSFIKKILGNPAVIGQYQPHTMKDGKRVPEGEPVEGYYPAIVPPDLFFAVQKKLKANQGKGGRNGKWTNLFRHLVTCAYCGGAMQMEDKGDGYRLVCHNNKRGLGCERQPVTYREVEDLILDNCHRLDPKQVLPDDADKELECSVIRERIAGKEGRLEDIERRIANFTAQIGKTNNAEARDRYEAASLKLDEERAALEDEIEGDRAALERAEANKQTLAAWQEDFEALRKAINRDDAAGAAARERLNMHLRELIDKIEVFGRGHRKLYDAQAEDKAKRELKRSEPDLFKANGKRTSTAWLRHPAIREANDGEDIAERIEAGVAEIDPQVARSKRFQAFLQFVTKERMSRAGRFVRVHFRTGQQIDLVPDGSLASGTKLVRQARGKKRAWQFVSPTLERLWQTCQ